VSNGIDLNQKVSYVKPDSIRDLLEITLIATATAGLFYFLYFQLAPWIWKQNLPFKSEDVLPWILSWLVVETERDGVELYALYSLVFLNLFFVSALSCGWKRIAGKPIRNLLALPLVAVSVAFLYSIGFHPPMNALARQTVPKVLSRSLTIMAVILPILFSLYYLQKHSVRWALLVSALLLIPVCIGTEPPSWGDCQYILDPALRLFHGAKVSEIYFQYDLLLSLIGLAWLKLQLDLNLFQAVGQGAYYLLFLTLFAFSRRWFLDKRLPAFLLVSLVLVRIYAGEWDASYIFQVTPLRLDMWLILLILVYFKGPYHWSAGLFCALMLVFHKNFGIIYSAAYLQLLLTLGVLNTVVLPDKIKTASMALRIFFEKNYHNLALILVGALAYHLIFRSANEQGGFYYQKLGIGFMRIAANSFYWYVVVISGLAFALLLKLRGKVSDNYLTTGFCLIYLAFGNSLYFFGRSHENNIINISAILVLLFFLLIDMVSHSLASASDKPAMLFIRRNFAIIVSLTFITAITIWYGDSIRQKIIIQRQNVRNRQFFYPSKILHQEAMSVASEVKSVTGNSPKVYFVTDDDFLLHYYGGYAPVGYYNPLFTWISKSDFNAYLQELVDNGYYLVTDENLVKNVLPYIKVSHNMKIKGNHLVSWK